jgi:hypothetical protein
MKRPEINGWEVTTNENGIKMATLPRDTMEEILKFVEYADKQLRLGDVVGRSEQLVCDHSKHPFFRVLNKTRKCNGCGEIYEAN